ncbi:MAG: hypothetical protein WCF16_07680, partial [Alphaproteobacteria bacterium]
MPSDVNENSDENGNPPELRAEPRPVQPRFRRSRMWIAVVALAAFGGFTWYAYKQAIKTGEQTVAPLIAADEQPTRAKPEEPGGMEVPHQDKSVYERMGSQEPPPKVETLLPPPETPMERPAPPQESKAMTGMPPTATPPASETSAAAMPPAAPVEASKVPSAKEIMEAKKLAKTEPSAAPPAASTAPSGAPLAPPEPPPLGEAPAPTK